MRSAFGGASVLELREKVLDRCNGLGLILLLQIQEEVSDDQAMTFGALARRLKRLIPVHAAMVTDVCCFGEAAEMWVARMAQPPHIGLLRLREALDALGAG